MQSESPTICGYADAVSVEAGQTIGFHISSAFPKYSIEIYRSGRLAVLMARIENVEGSWHDIPDQAFATGCCWPVSYQLEIPNSWSSGAYRARLCAGEAPDFHQHDIFFAVRSKQPGSTSSILLQLCTNTYAAYNNWGGHSLYAYNSLGNLRAHCVSFDRPGLGYHGGCLFETWELPFIQWAEANDITLEYGTNYDLHAFPELLNHYKLVLSVGHDEYWSASMRNHAEAHVERGGNIAFFSGNTIYWQIRFENSGRILRCHKDSVDEDPVYLSGDHQFLTTRWSDPRLQRPENLLTGVSWESGGYHRSHGMYMTEDGAYTLTRADHWVFEGTGLRDGDRFGGEYTIVGYEADGCEYTFAPDGRPYPTTRDGTSAEFVILAQAPAARFSGHKGTATMGICERRGTVFTASTTDWAHGLAGDPIVQRITRNIITRLSAAKS